MCLSQFGVSLLDEMQNSEFVCVVIIRKGKTESVLVNVTPILSYMLKMLYQGKAKFGSHIIQRFPLLQTINISIMKEMLSM